VTGQDYAKMMYSDGYRDGFEHLPSKYADEPEYSTGYARGENAAR
jgi:hypothetical protein